MIPWHSVPIAAVTRGAADLAHLTLDLRGTPLAGSHRVPGQYVRLRWEGIGEGYFAIASAPDPHGKWFEFLVKRNSPLSEALQDATPGARVEVTPPEGKGFPIDRARGKDVLLFATGSGISPIRSLLEEIRNERADFGEVSLYFGVRTPDAFAYVDDLEIWRHEGIRVVQTVSRPGNAGWQGLQGYVQAHVGDVNTGNAVAFLCGQDEMIAGVTSALTARGLPANQIFLNV